MTTATSTDPDPVQPIRIDIPEVELAGCRERVAEARWPDAIDGTGWDYGIDTGYLRGLADYWRSTFDWRAQEEDLNSFPHFRATIDGTGIHFVHARVDGALRGRHRVVPLLLLHGWPGSFYQMWKLIPHLTGARRGREAHGRDDVAEMEDVRFDVVVPSLPGFGFSDRPHERGMTVGAMAPLMDRLMRLLGYDRYAVAGGDLGAGVALALKAQVPERLIGVLTSGGNPYLFQVPDDLSDDEQTFVRRAQVWMQQDGAYAMLQSTKPQTIGHALNDSPVGLAAYLIDKYRSWSDCRTDDGTRDVARCFTRDELLTFVSLYWFTETIASSMRLYYENAHDSAAWSAGGAPPKADVPSGLVVWAGDIAVPPREWAERSGTLRRYTRKENGGHFAEWEQPVEMARELRAFFGPLPDDARSDTR